MSGGWSDGAVVGDAASGPCFRLSDAFASAGVLVAPDDMAGDAAGAVAEEDPACGWGIVLCCFCGELLADDDAFFGELFVGVGGGLVTDGGALEYRVTAGVGGTLPAPLCMGANGLGGALLGMAPFMRLLGGGGLYTCISRSFDANFLSASIHVSY